MLNLVLGNIKEKIVFLPRIPFILIENINDSLQFKRKQFPIRLCFAMTINKAQWQTLNYVGIYLREPLFSHGQLYVALSRVRTGNCVKVLNYKDLFNKGDSRLTKNAVFQELFTMVNSSKSNWNNYVLLNKFCSI